MKKKVNSDLAPDALGPYSQAIQTTDFVYLSGQVPMNKETGQLVEGGIEEQTRQVFKNLNYVLNALDLDLNNIVKVNVFLADAGDFEGMNKVYAEQFSEPYPARSCVAVKEIPVEGALVEIEAIAVKK